MARLKYLFAMVILLIWVASLLLKYDPRFYGLSLLVDLGSAVTVIVLALSALIWRKSNALTTFSLSLAVLIVSDFALFAYRLNNVCGPGDHIIQSEAGAIKVAKVRALDANYGSSQYFDSKPDLVDFGQSDDCCSATRTRTVFGVIVWEVSLHGETTEEMWTREVSAFVALSNCGVLFRDESVISAVPKKVDTIWPKIK